MKSKLSVVMVLLFFLAGISSYYDYSGMLQLPPQGSHIWRQSDALSMAQNYRQFHLPFTTPATYNLQSEEGKVAGEFPLFYFLAAQFQDVSFALRCMHSLLLILGIIAVFWVGMYFLKDEVLALFVALLFFTSPLLVFYGNNYLSDVPAISFAFAGWALFFHAHKQWKTGWTWVAFLCFTMAMLLKASQAINGILLLLLYILSLSKTEKIKRKDLLPFSLFLIPACWYVWAKSYNSIHHDTYYFLSVSPIWKLSLYDIGLGVWRMVVSLSNNYFWRPMTVLLLLSSCFLLLKWKKVSHALRTLITVSLMLVGLYILFFYKKMIGHEYYYTPFFVFGLFAIIGLLKVYKAYHAENVFSHTALYLLLIPNIIFCKHFVAEKLTHASYNGYLSSEEMQEFLVTKGVTEDKTVVSIPDPTPNHTLYQLKRKGYTEFNDYKKAIRENQADYLLAGSGTDKEDPLLQPLLSDSIGSFHGFVLYKLK